MIILLNGASSSGKSTIAAELQKQYTAPLLSMGIDMFLNMMPKQYLYGGAKASEGFKFEMIEDEEGPITRIFAGKLGEKVCDIVPQVAHVMAQNELSLIIDEVLFEDDSLKHYVNALHQHHVYFIGIHCSLAEISKREISRGNRYLGLAREQISRVHGPTRYYDLAIDTDITSATDSAKQIISFIEDTPNPKGFKKLYRHFYE